MEAKEVATDFSFFKKHFKGVTCGHKPAGEGKTVNQLVLEVVFLDGTKASIDFDGVEMNHMQAAEELVRRKGDTKYE